MGFIQNLTANLFDSSTEKARKRAEAIRFENLLNEFMSESEIRYKLTNKDKPFEKEYELYRYVFRRCRVITYLLENKLPVGTCISIEDIKEIEQYAVKHYFKNCAETLYGPVKLKLTMPMVNKLERQESQTLAELLQGKKLPASIQGYVYIGICTSGKSYIGQTIRSPEKRYLEHREFGTGPYKFRDDSVEWKVIHKCVPSELDYWESYYIGIHNAYENGFNDNRGKNTDSYELGKANSAQLALPSLYHPDSNFVGLPDKLTVDPVAHS